MAHSVHQGLHSLRMLDPSARRAPIKSWQLCEGSNASGPQSLRVYEGLDASGGLRPSVYTCLNDFAENLRHTH